MSRINNTYARTLNQTADMIAEVGDVITILVQGHIGTGKSSLLKILAKKFPTHKAIFLDCTTMVDSADMFMIKYSEDGLTFKTIPMEDLGLHLPDQPIILMFDELGKANRSVLLSANRVMLERKHSTYTMHKKSIVFATTNKGTEGVGDILPAHTRNRLTVVEMSKGDNADWVEWGIDNGIDHALLGWCAETPQLFAEFSEDPEVDPDDNPYVFHPRSTRTAFVTPRSLEKASHILKRRHLLDEESVTSLLMGTIGVRAALDLAAFIALADDLPTLEQIKNDPTNAPVPDSPAAVAMVIYRTLATVERNWVQAWLTYMDKLPKPLQSLFVNGVRKPHYERRACVTQNLLYQEWCKANSYQFSADKK